MPLVLSFLSSFVDFLPFHSVGYERYVHWLPLDSLFWLLLLPPRPLLSVFFHLLCLLILSSVFICCLSPFPPCLLSLPLPSSNHRVIVFSSSMALSLFIFLPVSFPCHRRQGGERRHCDSSGVGEHRWRPGRPRDPYREDRRRRGREGVWHRGHALPGLLREGGEAVSCLWDVKCFILLSTSNASTAHQWYFGSIYYLLSVSAVKLTLEGLCRGLTRMK